MSKDRSDPPEGLDAVADALGVTAGVLGPIDPVGFAGALVSALTSNARHPRGAARALARYPMRLAEIGITAAGRAVGARTAGPMAIPEKDRRFSEQAWSDNASFFALLQLYLLNRKTLLELIEASPVSGATRAKALFAAGLVADAASPTNFLATNPAALRVAFETGGVSLARGMRNFLEDLVQREGWPRKVDTTPFELGKNMAASAGRVVYRNDLIELIQYDPTTPTVHEIPLVMCPPWINKYYIMDLAPKKSLVEWAVGHGLTTFAISYRNPDSSMAGVSFDDYLLQGPRAAIDVASSIAGSPCVNTLAVCLGGTLNTALLAYLDATGRRGLVHTSTYLNSLTDHEGAGTLGTVFTDEGTIAKLETSMKKKGYLEADQMARTFDLLRANDLVFNYVASGWLMGQDPPAFDLLAWNEDATRMPAKMHSFYLRKCWQDNALARDELELAGETLRVSEIDVETYIVAAIEDHIVPWRSSYRTTQILKGESRFVLSTAGHIAGIVNPPSPKTKLWTNDALPENPDTWLAGATETQDTWWNDWARWITARSGALVEPPPLGNDAYPAGAQAPGTYVLG